MYPTDKQMKTTVEAMINIPKEEGYQVNIQEYRVVDDKNEKYISCDIKFTDGFPRTEFSLNLLLMESLSTIKKILKPFIIEKISVTINSFNYEERWAYYEIKVYLEV